MASMYPPASVVEITGLHSNVELNGMFGVVERHVHGSDGRLEVVISGRRMTRLPSSRPI